MNDFSGLSGKQKLGKQDEDREMGFEKERRRTDGQSEGEKAMPHRPKACETQAGTENVIHQLSLRVLLSFYESAQEQQNRHSQDSGSKSIDRRNHSVNSQRHVRMPTTAGFCSYHSLSPFATSPLNSFIYISTFEPPGLLSTTKQNS